MKEYKVGDTIYVKGKINQIDKYDTSLPYCVDFENGAVWISSVNIIDELPTAEPVKPVLPEKVVLTKEQAEIVEGAHGHVMPACYISEQPEDEELLMKAYVNGYTVAKEKRYMVELDGFVTTGGAKQYLTNKDGKWFACRRMSGLHQDFTGKELNAAPEWAKQLNREEVTGDDD